MIKTPLLFLLYQHLLRMPPVVRYFFVGGVATLVYMLAGILLDRLCPDKTLLVNTLAFCIAFTVSYAGQRYLTFARSTSPLTRAMPRFLLTNLCGLGLNTFCVASLLHMGLHYYLCMPLASLLVPLVVYPIQKHWAFSLR